MSPIVYITGMMVINSITLPVVHSKYAFCMFTDLSSVKLNVIVNQKAIAEDIILPESLYRYIDKPASRLKNILTEKKFVLTEETQYNDDMSGSGWIYEAKYECENQTIAFVERISEDRKEHTILTVTSQTPMREGTMSKEQVIYYMKTIHLERLRSYGFKVVKEDTDDDGIESFVLHKGDMDQVGGFIICKFSTSTEFLIEFNNGEA